MTNREQIVMLRGAEVSKVLCSVETSAGTLSLVGFGYENYPEPNYYAVSLNGNYLRDGVRLLSGYWEDDAIAKVKAFYPQYDIQKLDDAVGYMEKFPW